MPGAPEPRALPTDLLTALTIAFLRFEAHFNSSSLASLFIDFTKSLAQKEPRNIRLKSDIPDARYLMEGANCCMMQVVRGTRWG